MATVIYNNSAIIPAPLVNINKEIQLAPDGTKLGVLYSGTLTGKFVSHKGSPQSGTLTGASWGGPFLRFWQVSDYPPDESVPWQSRLKSIENKQEALRALFATDGQWLEFQSVDGTTPLKCQPRIKGITFAEGIWFEVCDYTVQFECDVLYLNGSPEVDTPFHDELISSASESWQIEDAEVIKTYRLTHSMSAVGKRQFDSEGNQPNPAWMNAKDFIQNRFTPGYANSSSFAPITGQSIVENSFLASGNIINFANYNPYNYIKNETVDELAGSYSLVENWILAPPSSGTDVYAISVRKFSSDPNTTTNASIQGTIHGFFVTPGDYDVRAQAAEYVWSNLQGANLYQRVQNYASGVVLNSQALVGSVDHNPLDGTVSYNYEFSDRLTAGDVFEEYTISRNISQADYKATITLAGKIIGRRYESDTDPNQKFQRAQVAWSALYSFPSAYLRVVNSNFFPEINDLKQNPVGQSVDMDEPGGMISYSFEFNNRKNDGDIQDENVKEEYSLGSTFSRDDGRTLYTINGTIEGLSNIVGSGSREAKYASASGYFYAVALPQMLTRVISLAVAPLSYQNPISTEIQLNPTIGQVTYNYQFSNEPAPYVSGALSELITVQDMNKNADVKVLAKIPIIGRVGGPLLQDMSTTQEKLRSLEIESVFGPAPGISLLGDYNSQPNYDGIVSILVPSGSVVYKEDDSQSWVPRSGRYSRSVKWTYQA